MESFGGGNGSDYAMGGWISESCLAFARLLPIVMHAAVDLQNDHHGVTEFACMIQMCHVVLSSLMTDECVNCNKIGECIKLSLSSIHKFQHSVWAVQTATEMWSTKGDFLSLLNFSEQMRKFGSVLLLSLIHISEPTRPL